jgi:hypothetical protein
MVFGCRGCIRRDVIKKWVRIRMKTVETLSNSYPQHPLRAYKCPENVQSKEPVNMPRF